MMLTCCTLAAVAFAALAVSALAETGEDRDDGLIVLPSVDISPWLGGKTLDEEEEEAIVSVVRKYAATYGTLFVCGVPESLMNAQDTLIKVFNDVPEEEKQQLHVQANGFTRGFVLPGSESGSSKYREVKEAFSLGKEWADGYDKWANELEGPNVWPRSLSGTTKEQLIQLYEDSSAVAMAIVQVLEKVLAVPKQSLVETCVEGDRISLLRLFHYFATPNKAQFSSCGGKQECIGSSPHTDWGFLTVVGFKHKDLGLQVFHDDRWQSVVEEGRAAKGWSILVNFGDYLSVATEGRLVSPVHRVIPQSMERYSFVYFFYPNFNTSLQVGPGAKDAKQKLSLLQQQSGGARETPQDNAVKGGEKIESFGRYIAMKWAQVFRETRGKEEL